MTTRGVQHTVNTQRRKIPMKTAKKTQTVQTFVFRPLNKLTTITVEKTMV